MRGILQLKSFSPPSRCLNTGFKQLTERWGRDMMRQRRGGRLPWNVGAAAFLRNLTQLGVPWCEALSQSQISMPWTATDPQDHVGGCAPHNPNATSPRPADTRQGARPSGSVNRMSYEDHASCSHIFGLSAASQLLLAGRKGAAKKNSKICKWPFARSLNLRGYCGRRRRAPVHACAHHRGWGYSPYIHLAITWQVLAGALQLTIR